MRSYGLCKRRSERVRILFQGALPHPVRALSEFALATALEIDGLAGVVALIGGTDGSDGPTEAAGGIVDGGTVHRGETKGLDARDYLSRNDSYHYLKATDDLLVTGPTFTNVMDLRLFIID